MLQNILKEINKNKQPQVNLQRGHQGVIGIENIDWDTTYRQKYTPKKMKMTQI